MEEIIRWCFQKAKIRSIPKSFVRNGSIKFFYDGCSIFVVVFGFDIAFLTIFHFYLWVRSNVDGWIIKWLCYWLNAKILSICKNKVDYCEMYFDAVWNITICHFIWLYWIQIKFEKLHTLNKSCFFYISLVCYDNTTNLVWSVYGSLVKQKKIRDTQI